MAEDIPRMPLVSRPLSPVTQLILVAALFLVVGIAIQVWPVIRKNAADQSEHAQPARLNAAAGTFRPTKEQWAGFKIEPVRLVTFHPAQATEGKIAIDDDLTPPAFSHYSRRGIKLIAKLGDHGGPGAAPFEIQAREFL